MGSRRHPTYATSNTTSDCDIATKTLPIKAVDRAAPSGWSAARSGPLPLLLRCQLRATENRPLRWWPGRMLSPPTAPPGCSSETTA